MPNSAYARSVGQSWSETDYLLALVYDQLAAANWQRGGGEGAYPKPLVRPGSEPDRTSNSDVVILARVRERAARRKEA